MRPSWWKEILPAVVFGVLTVVLLLVWREYRLLGVAGEISVDTMSNVILVTSIITAFLVSVIFHMILVLGVRSLSIARRLADQLASRDRKMVKEAAEPIVVLDVEGVIQSANDAALEIVGMPADQIVGKHFSQQKFFNADQVKNATYHFQRRAMGHSEPYDFEMTRKNGSKIIVEIKTSIIKEMGEVIGYQLLMHDVTEKRAAEAALKASEERYRGLFENMLDGQAYCQMVYDKSGKPIDFVYLDVNHQFEPLTGLKDVVGKKVTQVIPGIEKTNPEIFEIYGRVADGGQAEKFESFLPQLGRWLRVSVFSPAKGYFVAVFNDISVEKKAIEDLQREKSKDDALLEGMGEGMVAMDRELKIIFFNSEADKLFELKGYEGKKWPEAVMITDDTGNPIDEKDRPVIQALESGKIKSSSDFYFKNRNGRLIPISIVASPVFEDSKVTGVVALYRDITKEKEIDRAKTEFVSLASHQLRTPLSIIKWYTEIMLDEKESGTLTAEQKKFLEQIYTSGHRMVELVNALLNVSRIEMGTVAIEPVASDLAVLSDQVIAENVPRLTQKNLKLSKVYGRGLGEVLVDQKLYQLVLQNIFTNSAKYTPVGGKIEVKIENKADEVLISVKDNGVGIPASLQSQVFTKLFRAENAKAQEPDGTGLGLYLAKSVVEAYGGRIWFESQENKGTTFYFTVPMGGMQKVTGSKTLI